MRIVIISGFQHEHSTAFSILNGLGKAYSQNGHLVTAIGIHPFRKDNPRKFRECDGDKKTSWGKIVCLFLNQGNRLESIFKNSNIVHFHHYLSYVDQALIDVWRACRITGIPRLTTLQDYGNSAIPTPTREQALLEAFLSESEWVTTLSHFCAQKIKRDMPSLSGQIRVIPDGFNPSEFDADRIPFQTDTSNKTVVCVARLCNYKGIDIILRAWKIICLKEKNAFLRICGSDNTTTQGHFQRMTRKLGLTRKVKFLGEVSRKKVWNEIHGSVFTVLPSRHEAFGMAIIESMAAGKPVIATRSGGPQEIIKDGVSGLIVPPENPQAMAKAISSILKNPALHARLSKNAKRASRKFSWNLIAKRYSNLFHSKLNQELIGKKSTATR